MKKKILFALFFICFMWSSGTYASSDRMNILVLEPYAAAPTGVTNVLSGTSTDQLVTTSTGNSVFTVVSGGHVGDAKYTDDNRTIKLTEYDHNL